MMISILNCQTFEWTSIKLLVKQDPLADAGLTHPAFLRGSSVYPVLESGSDKVSRFIVLGGVDIRSPMSGCGSQGLHFTDVNLMGVL